MGTSPILILVPDSNSCFFFLPRLFYKIKTTDNHGARMLARSLSAVNMRAVESCTPPPTTSRSARATKRSRSCQFELRWHILSYYFPCRYTSVPTLETNLISVIFLAAGRSLPQVPVGYCSNVIHNEKFLHDNRSGRNNCSYWWFEGTDWRVTHARTRGRSRTDARSSTAASPSKHLETFRSTRGLTQACVNTQEEKSHFKMEFLWF